jgi:hypothetical protein
MAPIGPAAGIPMAPRAAFEMPPMQPLAPALPGPPPPASEAASEAVPALQPGGIALPFDPLAKASLPFELPDLAATPITFGPLSRPPVEPGPPAAAAAPPPLPFTESMASAEPALPPGHPPRDVLRQAAPAPLNVIEIQAAVPLHVPCPAGHTLEVTRDLLGKEVLCPYCRKRFLPVWEKSLEYRRQKAKERIREETQLGRMWLTGAIVAAIAVLALIITLIANIVGKHY